MSTWRPCSYAIPLSAMRMLALPATRKTVLILDPACLLQSQEEPSPCAIPIVAYNKVLDAICGSMNYDCQTDRTDRNPCLTVCAMARLSECLTSKGVAKASRKGERLKTRNGMIDIEFLKSRGYIVTKPTIRIMTSEELRQNLFGCFEYYPKFDFWFIQFPDERIRVRQDGIEGTVFGKCKLGYFLEDNNEGMIRLISLDNRPHCVHVVLKASPGQMRYNDDAIFK